MKITPDSVENHTALKSGLDTIDHQKLTDIVEAAAQKEAAMGKDGAPHHLANWNYWRGLRRTGTTP